MKKSTDDLRKALTSAPNLDGFLKENEENFSNKQFYELLNDLF